MENFDDDEGSVCSSARSSGKAGKLSESPRSLTFFGMTSLNALMLAGTRNSFGPLQSMAARDELRRRRREELKARYEQIKKQKEMELKEKLQREAELEKLQRKAYVEQKKLAEKQRLEKEEERKRQRELWRQQLELASLHCSRKKLYYYGMQPWKRMIWSNRNKMEQAWEHFSRALLRQILAPWWKVCLERRQETAKTIETFRNRWCQLLSLRLWLKDIKVSKFYASNLVKRTLHALKEAVEDRLFYEEASVLCDHLRLYKWMWGIWKLATSNIKKELFLKEQVATRHAKRASCSRCLKAWKYSISDELSEKQRQKSRGETWAKINTWLEEYHQGKINSQLKEETTCQSLAWPMELQHQN